VANELSIDRRSKPAFFFRSLLRQAKYDQLKYVLSAAVHGLQAVCVAAPLRTLPEIRAWRPPQLPVTSTGYVAMNCE